MPSYKVPRTRPKYYVDEAAMNKGVSEYMAPTSPTSESKPSLFTYRTRDQTTTAAGRRDSDASQADSDRASAHSGPVSP